MLLRTAESVKDPVIEQENKSNVVIYYGNDQYEDANIHYQIGSGKWTTALGVQMCVDSEQNGYAWKYVINLGNESSLTVCFNEDNTSWDSNNSSNYSLKAGCYGIKNGVITKLQEPVVTPEPLIELDKNSASLYEGENTIITASVIDGSVNDIVWTNSDENVATVSATGEVLAVKEGTTTITVKKPSIKLKTKSVLTLKVGKTSKISAISTPGGKFKYKTSSKGIATVSSKGVIKAKKKGTAYITISRNGVKKKIKVVVK